jgi:L-ribulose-5-phosphate 3-epimerase
MTRIGVMQGRLLPPVGETIQCFPRFDWADEFSLAAQARIECIEWIYDQFGADVNPIATDEGVDSIRRLSELYGVRVASLCADYFMDWPLVRVGGAELEERLGVLRWLVGRSRRLGIERIVLPFVDASSINSDSEVEQVTATIGRALQAAEESGVELHLETSLDPDRFAELLGRQPSSLLKVNYDSGNSASLSYDPRREFAAYGHRVGSVHIKDRLKGGGTVPLGTGDADLPAVFDCLRDLGYAGDFVMQVARDVPGDEVRWARRNSSAIRHYRNGAAARGR